MGETSQKILRAILAGERDASALAALKNVGIRASVDEVAKSLQVYDGEPAKGKKRVCARSARPLHWLVRARYQSGHQFDNSERVANE